MPELYQTTIEVQPLRVMEKRIDGRTLSRKTVGTDKVTGTTEANSVSTTSIQSLAVTQAKLATPSVGQAQWKYEQVTVTVTAGGTTGTGTVTSGSIIIGYYPSTNQDKFVKSIAVSGTTVTVTMLAATIADNVFVVTLLKS